MDLINNVINYLELNIEIIELVSIVIISSIIFFIFLKILKKNLVKKLKTKKQISNVTVFLTLIKFLFAFFLLIVIIAFFYGDLGDLSFVAGLLTVALGWALQKPISGVVAWLILITRRPFQIGDRVFISNIKGDITDITLTHILLDEVGGTIDGEERSGRTIMIPTSIIFEKEIINYTLQDEYILVEIVTAITYDSNLEKAEDIILNSVKKIMKTYWLDFPKRVVKEPHIRLQFKESGIDVIVRYYTLTNRRNEIATNIRREIFTQFKKTDDVDIAYPHREVLFKKKK
jgi:small-conductance mechanosensitive channel